MGTVLGGRYLLRQQIGDPGRGLWRADDTTSRQTVVVKILDPAGRESQAVDRFLAQGQALSTVDHPAVVRVIDHGQDGSVPYQVLPYVLGESLRALLNRGGRLDAGGALRLLAGVADGLHAAGLAGVGQSDLSSADVILRLDGSPALVGLGGADPDPAASVRAAARLAYEGLTGAPPGDADPLVEVAEPARTVLGRALAADPAYPDLPALAAAARQVAGGDGGERAAAAPVRVAVPAVRSVPPAPPPTPAVPTPAVPVATVPVPTVPVPAPTAPVPTVPAPASRPRSAWKPVLVAAVVLLILGAGATAAQVLRLTPWVEPLAEGSTTTTAGATTPPATPTARRTSASPTATAEPTASADPSPVAAANPGGGTSSGGGSGGAGGGSGGSNPPPPPPPPPPPTTTPPAVQADYKLDLYTYSPVMIDGSCVFQIVYGDYGGTPFAYLRVFGGDCGTPTFEVASVQPNTDDVHLSGTTNGTGTGSECGEHTWRQVIGPNGTTVLGVQVIFPRTGDRFTFGVFGTVAPPAHRAC